MEFTILLEEFNKELSALRSEKLTVLERANRGIGLCQKTLATMRSEIHGTGPMDSPTEIRFFRDIKSIPLGQLVYYNEVRQCELRLPQLGMKPKLRYIRAERERINNFHNENLEFYRYLREGRNDRDTQFFTRRSWVQFPMVSCNYRYDGLFETSHDLLYAKFMGFERYGNYLLELENNVRSMNRIKTNGAIKDFGQFTFTQSPTAAMELIYAMREAKVINHGDFEIRAFVTFFCEAFNIEIKDPYGLFKQISQRKTKRSKFLQHLMDALLSALDNKDGFIP
ncbi:RteC domain-containing protein [Flagellimonas pacifica]|uniref:RteC protein n=1 Tax=Flagellimonas pacifica TaxID=1247520 RepID=A0A285MQV7_9FLAO|nr:RteC domain-containing protein [Allomuricauda parva]SNY99528.1 RteC protein [Allomuricauda parva]